MSQTRYKGVTKEVENIVGPYADAEANTFNHQYIGTEHVLLALAKHPGEHLEEILNYSNVTLADIIDRTEEILVKEADFITIGKTPRTPRVKEVIDPYLRQETVYMGHEHSREEHLLIALMREKEANSHMILVDKLELAPEKVRSDVENYLRDHGVL